MSYRCWLVAKRCCGRVEYGSHCRSVGLGWRYRRVPVVWSGRSVSCEIFMPRRSVCRSHGAGALVVFVLQHARPSAVLSASSCQQQPLAPAPLLNAGRTRKLSTQHVPAINILSAARANGQRRRTQ